MNKDRSKYPLTLQHLNTIKKAEIAGKSKNIFVEKLNCNEVHPENFYRPMSKIININGIE